VWQRWSTGEILTSQHSSFTHMHMHIHIPMYIHTHTHTNVCMFTYTCRYALKHVNYADLDHVRDLTERRNGDESTSR
jgi:hypothetical protein